MILVIFIFFIVGIMAIMMEAVLPYGIAATLGFLLIAVSGYAAYVEFGANLAILYCIMALSVAMMVTRLVVRSGLNWMTLRPPKNENSTVSGPLPSEPEPEQGEIGTVVAPLRPTGTVEVRGHRFAARSLSPEIEIPIGAVVKLVSRDSIYWLVEAAPEGSVEAAPHATDSA